MTLTMKRKLLKQIATEWRSNLWLGIELLIISTILFFIFDATASHIRLSNSYIGADITNVYRLQVGWRNESSPQYQTPEVKAGETEKQARSRVLNDSYAWKLKLLRELPGVTAAAPGSSAPYNYNFYGIQFHFTGNTPDSIKDESWNVNAYYVDPDYPVVFNMHGINGETPEQLAKMLYNNKAILTSNTVNVDKAGITQTDILNLPFEFDANGENATYTVGAVIPPIRRSDYEPAYHGTALFLTQDRPNNIYVRIKEGYDEDFINSVTDPESPINKGYNYVIEAKSMERVRDDLHRNDNAQLRNLIICMAFLLLTVFLGLLGTFWFRTQQRVREIALRKTTGATNGQIFRRLMGEGLLILTLATIPAMGLDALQLHFGLFLSAYIHPDDNVWITALLEALIIFALMATMIVAGIYFPASKAMNVEPADVLRGE